MTTLTRRLLLLTLIAVMPAITIWSYTEVLLRRAREAEVRDLALRQAQTAASELERILEGIRHLLVAVEAVPAIRAFDAPACVAYLAALHPKVPFLASIMAFDLEGRVRCRDDMPMADIRFDDRPYFKEAVATGAFAVGEFAEARLPQKPVLPLALPIRDAKGQTIGVIAAMLDLPWLGSRLAERTLPAGGSITVADRNGSIIVREPFPERFVGTRLPEDFQAQLHAPTPGTREVLSQDGTRRMLGYIPLGLTPQDLSVSIGLSSKAAYATVNQAAQRGFVLIAAAFGLALSLAWLIGHTFVAKPFQIMTDAVRAWRKGDYTTRIALPKGSGEVKVLTDAFNDLMDDIVRRQAALRDSEERVRLALHAGRMGTWWLSMATGGMGWSPETALLLGLDPNRTSGTYAFWRSFVHADDLAQVDALTSEGPENDERHTEYRVRIGNEERWLSTNARVLRNERGKPVQIIGILRDITTRKLADEHKQLLLDELNHRVKNTLATVQSIVAQTLRTNPEPALFRATLEGRLLALSQTHDLLTRNAWRDADLQAILDNELAPYRREGDQRVSLKGPELRLPARTAINLGLVLHELATNAAKYGALSVGQGRLAVEWSVEPQPQPQGGSLLRFAWRETNGPTVAAPKRQGFGSRLIQRSIEGELIGKISLRFLPTGAQCEILIPVSAEIAGRPVLALVG